MEKKVVRELTCRGNKNAVRICRSGKLSVDVCKRFLWHFLLFRRRWGDNEHLELTEIFFLSFQLNIKKIKYSFSFKG